MAEKNAQEEKKVIRYTIEYDLEIGEEDILIGDTLDHLREDGAAKVVGGEVILKKDSRLQSH